MAPRHAVVALLALLTRAAAQDALTDTGGPLVAPDGSGSFTRCDIVPGDRDLYTDGCRVDEDCRENFECNIEVEFCRSNQELDQYRSPLVDSPTWYRDHESAFKRCDWVGQDPGERCVLVGWEPTIGCADPSVPIWDVEACNYTVAYNFIHAYAACCGSCRYGKCKSTKSSHGHTKGQHLAKRWVEIICGAACMIAIFSCFIRSVCRPHAHEKCHEKLDDSAVERAGLVPEIEREQRFTIRGVDLFWNRLEAKERANPPARAPKVPERPGEFAESDGTFCPHSWPGGMGTRRSPRYTIFGLLRFLWIYKVHDMGQWAVLQMIACQCFILTYPSINAFYVGLIFDQATGSHEAVAWGFGGDGNGRLRLILLIFTGYIAIYALNLWVQWKFWLVAGLGRSREAMRNALLLKVLRLPKAKRPSPGEVAGVLLPRVDDAVSLWYAFLRLCGIPCAMTFQIVIVASASRKLQNTYMIFGPLCIFGSLVFALWRHKRTLYQTSRESVLAHDHLYSALEVQTHKPRLDDESTVCQAREDTETFAVANFVYRRRFALSWFTALQIFFESSIYGRLVICFSLLAAGLSVMSGDRGSLNASELFVIYQILNEIEVTARKTVRIVVEFPAQYQAVALIANIFNAEDLGNDAPDQNDDSSSDGWYDEVEEVLHAAATKIGKLFRRKLSSGAWPTTSPFHSEDPPTSPLLLQMESADSPYRLGRERTFLPKDLSPGPRDGLRRDGHAVDFLAARSSTLGDTAVADI